MLEKIQTRMDESDKRIEAMATPLQDCNQEPYGKEINDKGEGKIRMDT